MSTEAGAGGKFRKRPVRRAPTTPYDRPPAAARRGLSGNGGQGGGWISRLVDPASKMIADGATRFFSSVFRKRLGPPPPPPPPQPQLPEDAAPEGNIEVVDVAIKMPMLNMHREEEKDGQTFKDNSNKDGISELEQLLKQKTFSRLEFERLTELLRSRTVGLSTDNGGNKFEASTSKPDILVDREEKTTFLHKENEAWRSKSFNNTPNSHPNLKLSSAAFMDSEEKTSSLTELAKAYMSSRSSKPAASHLALHSMSRRDSATPSSPQMMLKSSEISVGQKSSIRFAGIPENGTRTPRSQGRSALYQMSRSPYFKAQNVASNKGHELSDGGYNGHPGSQLAQSDSYSAGKQVLKRRSSLLDSDLGSIGPIRRIRRKSNLEPPPKELSVATSERYLSTSGYMPQGFEPPSQRPSLSNLSKYNIAVEDADMRQNGFPFVPHQSSQMAERILELVDKMSPSPKKVAEIKTGIMEESPTKLTFDMLNKKALKSVKDIDAGKVLTIRGNGNIDGSRESNHLKGLSSPDSVQIPETNGSARSASKGKKVMSEVNGMDLIATSTSETKSVATKGSPVMVPDPVSLHRKPAFKMQVPESLLEVDADIPSVDDASGNIVGERENPNLYTQNTKPVTSEAIPQKFSFVSSGFKSGSDVVPRKEEAQKLQVKVSRKDNDFTFPVAPSESSSRSPPTPSVQGTFSEQVSSKEEPALVFNFGSRSISTLNSSIMGTSSSDSSGLKFGFTPSSLSEIPVSAAAITDTKLDLSSPIKNDEISKTREPVKSAGALFPSTLASTAPPVFAFGASSSAGLSNGSSKTTSPALSVPNASTPAPSESSSGIIGGVNATPSVMFSSTATPAKLPFAVIPAPTSAVVPPAAASDVPSKELKDPDQKPFKSPIFGSSNLSSEPPATFSSSASSSIFSFGLKASTPPSSTSGQLFGLQPSKETSTTAVSAQSSAPASAAGNSVFTFGSSGFGASSTASTFPFASTSSAPQSSAVPFATDASASGASGGLSFALAATGSSLFGMSNGSTFASTATGTANLFSSLSTPSFTSAGSSSNLLSSTPPASSSIFTFGGSTSSQSIPSTFGSSTTSSGFPFGQSASALASQAAFGASSAPFSFSMPAASPTPAPVFSMQAPVSFGSSSSGNDQMNVEDSMTDDTNHTSVPATPVFGQVANSTLSPGINFGTSHQTSGFQFGSSQPTPVFGQAASPFQAPSNSEFMPGGSFSLGSGGGDKTGRRIVKVRRDKLRKK